MSISIGSSISAYSASSSLRPQRPDAATVAGDIFSKLDTKGQGYLQLSDFKDAFASIDSDSASSSSAEEVFAQIDADSDGKVTQDELTSKLQELADTLDSQFNQSRVAGGMPPPPPPQGEDQGLTEDEMTAMASDAASTDTNLASLLSTVVSNFDAADTDGDGRVTFKEAQAYAQQNASSSSTSESSTSTATSASTAATSSDSSSAVLRRILDLVRAYGLGEEGSTSNSSAISVSA